MYGDEISRCLAWWVFVQFARRTSSEVGNFTSVCAPTSNNRDSGMALFFTYEFVLVFLRHT
jgi:hypothetical protein